MRTWLLIAATAVLLGGVGCADEAEQRRERLADQKQTWGDVAYMPDKILEMGEWAPQAPSPNKAPTASPAIVQVSSRTSE